MGIAAALASIAIWAPRPARVRILVVTMTLLFIPVAYVELAELLSKPKPMSFEWYYRNTDKAILLGTTLDEGKAIYLWLRLDGSLEPRNYKIPWNLKTGGKAGRSLRRRGQAQFHHRAQETVLAPQPQ